MRRCGTLLFVLCSAAVSREAAAARPMVTDDARVTDPGACQVEAWTRRNVDSTEYWALPACNLVGNVEVTFGGAWVEEKGARAFTDQVVQAKTLIKPYEPGGWGIGFTAGTIRHPRRESASGWPGDYYVNVPASIAAGSDDWVVHVNAGAVRRRDERRTITTWGVGSEVRLRPTLYLIPEAFVTDRGRPFVQAGLRYWIIPERVQMDATYGNRAVSDGRERWFSIGLRILTPPLIR